MSTVDIIKNGYIYSDNFTVAIAPLVDSGNNTLKVTKNNLILDLKATPGIDLESITISTGNYNPTTGIWAIPTLSSDQPAFLTFLARVTDETQGPYQVTLEAILFPDDNLPDNNKFVKVLGGLTQGDLLAALATLTGPQGDPGADGDDGDDGGPGPANVIQIGTVTQGTAAASITGTSPNQILNLVLPKGDKGDQGDPGNIGPTSTTPGPQGDEGLSAYEVWLSEGNTGTEAAFLLSLKGDQGDPGPAGTATPDWTDVQTRPTITASGGNVTGTLDLDAGTLTLTAPTGSGTADNWGTQVVQITGGILSGDGTAGNPLTVTINISDISGLQTALDSKVDDSQVQTNVPSGAVFTDNQNTYVFDRVGDNLTVSLNGGAAQLINICCSTVPTHTHTIGDVTNLQSELDSKLTDAPNDSTTYARQGATWTAVNSRSVDRATLSGSLFADFDGTLKTGIESRLSKIYLPKSADMSGYILTEVAIVADNAVNVGVVSLSSNSVVFATAGDGQIPAPTGGAGSRSYVSIDSIVAAQNNDSQGYWVEIANNGSDPGLTTVGVTLYLERDTLLKA